MPYLENAAGREDKDGEGQPNPNQQPTIFAIEIDEEPMLDFTDDKVTEIPNPVHVLHLITLGDQERAAADAEGMAEIDRYVGNHEADLIDASCPTDADDAPRPEEATEADLAGPERWQGAKQPRSRGAGMTQGAMAVGFVAGVLVTLVAVGLGRRG